MALSEVVQMLQLEGRREAKAIRRVFGNVDK
jgi:hypothetical protein